MGIMDTPINNLTDRPIECDFACSTPHLITSDYCLMERDKKTIHKDR
jgi:hypothetical protein